jgi:hypothetical protein
MVKLRGDAGLRDAVIVAALALSASACGKSEATAKADTTAAHPAAAQAMAATGNPNKRPTYAECLTGYPPKTKHWSGTRTLTADDPKYNVIIELAPAKGSHVIPDGELPNGQIVGFIINTGAGESKKFAVHKGDKTPSVACVWVYATGADYHAILYSGDTPQDESPINVDWNDHRSEIQGGMPIPHPAECAMWKPANDLSPCYPGPTFALRVDSLRKLGRLQDEISTVRDGMTVSQALAEGLWLTCSTDGCCHLKTS